MKYYDRNFNEFYDKKDVQKIVQDSLKFATEETKYLDAILDNYKFEEKLQSRTRRVLHTAMVYQENVWQETMDVLRYGDQKNTNLFAYPPMPTEEMKQNIMCKYQPDFFENLSRYTEIKEQEGAKGFSYKK